MIKSFKDKAMAGAAKLMQSQQAQKLMTSPEFQKVMMKAFQTGMKVKSDLDSTKRNLAKKMNVATEDDLVTLKRKLDRLERRVTSLRDENADLKAKLSDAEGGEEGA